MLELQLKQQNRIMTLSNRHKILYMHIEMQTPSSSSSRPLVPPTSYADNLR